MAQTRLYELQNKSPNMKSPCPHGAFHDPGKEQGPGDKANAMIDG